MVEFVKSFLDKMPSMSGKNTSRFLIDDFIFRLHYLITAKALYFASVFSVVLLMFDWVQCYTHNEQMPSKLMNVYCWMQNTFVLPDKLAGNVGDELASPGIDQELPGDNRLYISYYQWLPLFLLFQGCCFELGHFIWKSHEHSEMANMSYGFQFPIAKSDQIPMSDEEVKRGLNLIAQSINNGWSKRPWLHRPLIFLMCVFINGANGIFQVFLLTKFFKFDKLSTGWEVYQHLTRNYFERTDPLVAVFPRIVKCIFYQFGSGGSVQTHDVMCLLPFNVYTEKFFALCLVWFYILTAASMLHFLFWFVLLASSPLRKFLASMPVFHMFPNNDFMVEWVKKVELRMGNWFVMWLLCKNVHPNHLRELLPQLDVAARYNDNSLHFNGENEKRKLLDDATAKELRSKANVVENP